MGAAPSTEPMMVIPGVLVASKSDISSVCHGRAGTVLKKQSILKCDHWPSARNTKLKIQLPNAANFRRVGTLPVYGSSQPQTPHGIQEVAQTIAAHGYKRAVWFNMREEPMIYINGRPYCVKDRSRPFKNQSMGIAMDSGDVDSHEQTLKAEILAEAHQYGGKVLLMGETTPTDGTTYGESYWYWEAVSSSSVYTVREAFAAYEAIRIYEAGRTGNMGVPIEFVRCPVTDENMLDMMDTDALMTSLVRKATKGTALVFNCQLGRGRTTTANVIACMYVPFIDGGKGPKLPPAATKDPGPACSAVSLLVAAIDKGAQIKAAVDAIIDQCSDMQNIREAIDVKRNRYRAAKKKGSEALGKSHKEVLDRRMSFGDVNAGKIFDKETFKKIGKIYDKEKHEEAVGLLYLERYIYLIILQLYFVEMKTRTAAGETPFRVKFSEWANMHKMAAKFYGLLDRMSLD